MKKRKIDIIKEFISDNLDLFISFILLLIISYLDQFVHR